MRRRRTASGSRGVACIVEGRAAFWLGLALMLVASAALDGRGCTVWALLPGRRVGALGFLVGPAAVGGGWDLRGFRPGPAIVAGVAGGPVPVSWGNWRSALGRVWTPCRPPGGKSEIAENLELGQAARERER